MLTQPILAPAFAPQPLLAMLSVQRTSTGTVLGQGQSLVRLRAATSYAAPCTVKAGYHGQTNTTAAAAVAAAIHHATQMPILYHRGRPTPKVSPLMIIGRYSFSISASIALSPQQPVKLGLDAAQ